VLVIADLTKGTGRFNLTLGAIGTAVGIGASLYMPETRDKRFLNPIQGAPIL
jgi:hypothetical protein